MSLNLSRKPRLKYYSSDRIAQYLGNGSCIFVDINSQLNELFTKDEVIFFDSSDVNDFGKKIEFYTKNIDDVRRIAKSGWVKGHRNYNERIITSYFLDIAINGLPKGNYPWPIHQYFK